MKKLRSIIENAYYNGKLPKGAAPYMVHVLADIYSALVEHTEAEFIESEIKTILNGCGIKTRPRGIGWIAYR